MSLPSLPRSVSSPPPETMVSLPVPPQKRNSSIDDTMLPSLPAPPSTVRVSPATSVVRVKSSVSKPSPP